MMYMREAFTEISSAKKEIIVITNNKNIQILRRRDIRLRVNSKTVQLINILFTLQISIEQLQRPLRIL
jgi:hypothetical protein